MALCHHTTLTPRVCILMTVCNVANLGAVTWHEWDTFFDEHFKKVPGVSTYQHFTFTSAFPGAVEVKERVDSETHRVTILKSDPSILTSVSLPPIIPCGGMSAERQKYLHKEIRPFVADPYKDELCPPLP